MTEQRRKRLNKLIREARGRIMEKWPFFGILLMYPEFAASTEIKKISTDGECICFSPDYLEKLYVDEIDYILCHEIMHIICGHISRPTAFEDDNYHFACDISINSKFADMGMVNEKYPHLGQIHKTVPAIGIDVSGMSPEDILEHLPYSLYLFDEKTRGKFLPDSDILWNRNYKNIFDAETITESFDEECLMKDRDDIEDPTENDDSIDVGDDSPNGQIPKNSKITGTGETWEERIASAVKAAKSFSKEEKGCGDVPDFLLRAVEKTKESVADWKRILNSFLQEQINDYSFSPPDRRFADSGFFLPDFNEKDYISKEILFMADTSGSIDDDMLVDVFSEIKGAIEQFGGKLTAKLGFFDTAVTAPVPFHSVEDLMKIIPCGGGGTNFTAIFDYIRHHSENGLPACIVVFTDGEGPYPDENDTMSIPVLWILNNAYVQPPFGKTVRILPYEWSAAVTDGYDEYEL